MINKKNNARIDSIQSLRGLAYIGIFLCHMQFPYHWAGLGVSVFFVMSAFLLERKYFDVNLNHSFKDNINFSIVRIKKIYPLHIITMLPFVIYYIVDLFSRRIPIQDLLGLIFKVFLNITLLQTWFPHGNINRSLNSVSWFLSALAFLYFIYPVLRKWTRKIRLRFLVLVCISCLLLQVVFCVLFLLIWDSNHPAYIWFSYCFPIFRIGDFLWGICIARFYQIVNYDSFANGRVIKKLIFSFIELFAVVLVWFLYRCFFSIDSNSVIVQALQNSTTMCIPVASTLVFCFAVKLGFITRILSNRLFVSLGNISQYMFLIHYVIAFFCIQLVENFSFLYWGLTQIIIILIVFILTILVSLAYRRIERMFNIQIKT